MNRSIKKEEIYTIPNLLSFVRLLLIPLIIWLYCIETRYQAAVIVILLSCATDILDGYIARKYHMVSDLGKLLDPVADKLTQFSILICLISRYPLMKALAVLFFMKELLMSIFSYMTIKKTNKVNSAKWFGKLNTVVLYSVLIILILFTDISVSAANKGIILSGCVMVMSMVSYIIFDIRQWTDGSEKKKAM